MVASEVDWLISDAVKSTISSAGSARKPISISRRAPSEPNAVPMSIAASAIDDAREREDADQRDRVGGRRVGEVGAERRHDRGRQRHAAEQHVRRDAEERRGVVRDDRVLVEQLAQHRYGCSTPGPLLFCSQARHWLTQPTRSGASRSASTSSVA